MLQTKNNIMNDYELMKETPGLAILLIIVKLSLPPLGAGFKGFTESPNV